MVKELCIAALRVASAFLKIEKGSILVYTGAFMAVGVGGAALSIDIGRIVLLRTQLQNRADAGALAGAAQLDANVGAMERAQVVVVDSMVAYTTALQQAGEELPVLSVVIYPAEDDGITRDMFTAPTDATARFVEVLMERKTLSFFYAPAVNLLTNNANVSNETTLDARAVAMSDPYICKAQPLMICDPFSVLGGDPSDSLGDASNAGASVMLKQPAAGNGAWTAGNFGLLDLPDDSGSGATAVELALSSDSPEGCYGVSNVSTAPGSMINKVKNGLNSRFGTSSTTNILAPHVLNFPKDDIMLADDSLVMGDGVWDLATYWAARHPVVAMPAILDGASRFQIYLFELGVGYYRKNGGGKNVKFVLTADEVSGGGWTYVDPPVDYPDAAIIPFDDTTPDDNWVDGIPDPSLDQTTLDLPYERRLLKVAVLDCTNNDISGKTAAPGTATFIQIFLTEESADPPDSAIIGEVVQGLTANTSFEFHGNVRLVE